MTHRARRGMLHSMAWLVVAGVLATLAMTARYAQAEPVNVQVKIPVAVTVPDTCSGEAVRLEGDIHAVFHLNRDGKGVTHVTLNGNTQGVSGAGVTSGKKYVGSGNLHLQDKVTGALPQTVRLRVRFNLNGQGGTANLKGSAVIAATVSNNNQVTATVESAGIECK